MVWTTKTFGYPTLFEPLIWCLVQRKSEPEKELLVLTELEDNKTVFQKTDC